MAARRVLVVFIVLCVSLGLGTLLWHVLAPGGWTWPKLVMLAAFAGTAPWTGLCVANALVGFLVLTLTRDPARAVFPQPPLPSVPPPPTAIVVTVRNEDMRFVLPPLGRLRRELDAAGVGSAFTLWVLSDTLDLAATAAEQQAMAAFPHPVRYRRRTTNAGFKAGNVMDFLDHHAAGVELMVTLDADSEMSADAVLRLVRALQADPTLGIAQHLTVGLPATAAFPRLFQFGMRAGMRTWALGQAWWQGDEGPYWGHNAAVRIAPFREHCRLPLLPDGRHILSHDQVEAAMLRAAGWGVRVLPREDGSAERNPPALPDFLRRELRWQRGNMQYLHLLRLKLRPMGRWQLLQAILLFSGAPLYLLFLLAAAAAAATDAVSQFPAGAALSLTLAWVGALYSPKLLGYVVVALSPAERVRYSGGVRFAAGAATELCFTLLLDAIGMVAKTQVMLHLDGVAWTTQNRLDRSVGWCEAARLYWPQTVLGVLVFACFAEAGWLASLWAAPLAGGLLLAIPFAVLTANPRLGRVLQRLRFAAVPEEFDALPQHAPQPHAAPITAPAGAD
jgi:membrane glycosyltransferase